MSGNTFTYEFSILILAWIAQGERHIEDLKVTLNPRSLH